MTMYPSKSFFKRRVDKYTPKQVEIAKAIFALWKPESVFDFGCGIGGYLQGFYQCGCKVNGCDVGYENARPYIHEEIRDNIVQADVGSCFNYMQGYDLVISIEVAEHLEKDKADQFCYNLAATAKNIILLTAAGPGQRGKHHVNCQPKSYWISKFTDMNIEHSPQSTADAIKAIADLGDPFGICKNLMVFTI